jgi:hypothetical protein
MNRAWLRIRRGLSSPYFYYVLLPLALFFIGYLLINWGEIYRPFDPLSDLAVYRLQVERARHLQAYIGPYSRFHFHHPGPLIFYYAAAVEALLAFLPSGRIYLAQLLYNLLFLWVALHIVYRTLRPRFYTFLLALTTLAVLPLMGVNVLIDPWPPKQIVLPMLAFVLSAAAVASGRVRYLLPAAIAGSFVGQTHVGGALFVLPLMGLALFRYGLWRLTHPGRLDRRDRICLTASLVFLLVSLLPPLYEQLTSQVGNISLLYNFFVRGQDAGLPLPAGLRTRLLGESFSYVMSFYTLPLEGLLGLRAPIGILVLLFAAALFQGWCPGLPRELALLWLVAWPLSIGAASRVVGELLPYLMWFEYALVAVGYFMILVGIYRLISLLLKRGGVRFPPIHLPLLTRGVLLAAVVAVVLPGFSFHLVRLEGVIPGLMEVLAPKRDRTYMLMWRESPIPGAWTIATGLAYRLTQEGFRACVPAEWAYLFGTALVCRDPRPVYPVLLSVPNDPPVGTGYERMITYTWDDPQVLTYFPPGITMEAGYPRDPFVLQAQGSEFAFEGWSKLTDGVRWSEGPQAQLHFFAAESPPGTACYTLSLRYGGNTSPLWLSLEEWVGQVPIAGDEETELHLVVPATLFAESGPYHLRFSIPTESPGERPCQVAFRQLKLQSSPRCPPMLLRGNTDNWYPIETGNGTAFQWVRDDVSLRLFAPEPGWYRLAFTAISFQQERQVHLILRGTEVGQYTAGLAPTPVSQDLYLEDGWSEILLHVVEGCTISAAAQGRQDQRCLSVALYDLLFEQK